MEEREIMQRLNLVQADVSCVSGAVSKSASTGSDVFTDGDVRYIDPKVFRPFTSARQAAARLCRINGSKLRLLSAWAISDELLGAVKTGMVDINAKVEKAKAELAPRLPEFRQTWEYAHPEIMDYAGRFPTDAQILAGIGMQVAIYKVNPMEHGELPDGLAATVNGIAGQVLAEIAQDARDSFSPEATKASSRARDILARMRTKVGSLAFVDASLGSLGGMLDSVLAALPSTGQLTGNDFVLYAGLMNTLMAPERVMATAKTIADGGSDAAWAALTPQQAASASVSVLTPALVPSAPPVQQRASLDALLGQVAGAPAVNPASWQW